MLEGDLRNQEFGRQGNERIERDGNVAHVIKPEGTYSIIYGVHGDSNEGAIPIDPAQVPASAEYDFLENISNWAEDPLGYLYTERRSKYLGDFFTAVEKRGVKLAFADLSFQEGNRDKILKQESLIINSELVSGAALAGGLSQTRLSRRSVLKLGGYGLSVWFLMPFTSMLGRYYSSVSGSAEDATARYRKFSEALHPEESFFYGRLRHLAIAQKMQWLMERSGDSRHFSIIMGGFHVGLEDQLLEKPEERLALLRKTKEIWRPVVEPATFYTTALFGFDGQQWQVEKMVVNPQLKDLVLS